MLNYDTFIDIKVYAIIFTHRLLSREQRALFAMIEQEQCSQGRPRATTARPRIGVTREGIFGNLVLLESRDFNVEIIRNAANLKPGQS